MLNSLPAQSVKAHMKTGQDHDIIEFPVISTASICAIQRCPAITKTSMGNKAPTDGAVRLTPLFPVMPWAILPEYEPNLRIHMLCLG